VRQTEPVEHVGDGGKGLYGNAALGQRHLDLAQRNPGLCRGDCPQVVGMGFKQRATVAADLGRRRAAGPAHPLHQLDRR
jgi:hypothetical protein